MARFEEQIDSSDCICPYCGDRYQVECEDYSEDYRTEECGECGRKFRFCQVFSVDHHARPDCELNDEPHVWKPESIGDGRTHDFCAECGTIRSAWRERKGVQGQ